VVWTALDRADEARASLETREPVWTHDRDPDV
jgi:hypothetical protein